jgi:DNA-directed RNA polymerase beta' subunit
MEVRILNYNEDYERSMKTGKGFNITKSIPIDARQTNIRDPEGIYSSLFGGNIQDAEEIKKRHRCNCEKDEDALIGGFYEGIVCPKCGGVVELKEDELEMTGWIELDPPYCIINPVMYIHLSSIFGKDTLKDITTHDKRIGKGGFVLQEEVDKELKNPYYGIGIVEFSKRFDEILDALGSPKKTAEIAFIKENRDKIFSSKIPVISLLVRPLHMNRGSNPTVSIDQINKHYSDIVANVAYIKTNEYEDIIHENLDALSAIQNELNELSLTVITTKINGKKRVIREFVLGSRMNHSARHVLIPNTSQCRIDSIRIPYITFTEFYKFHIMRLYMKFYNVTIFEILDRWYNLVMNKDPLIMKIINLLITRTKGGLILYDNRNPTLGLGSIQALVVRGINDDIDDLTIQVHHTVLLLSGSDFDGDVHNNIPIFDTTFAAQLRKSLNPVRLLLDAATGRFNRTMNLLSDQIVAIFSFCNDDFDAEDFDNDPTFSVITPRIIAARNELYAGNLSHNIFAAEVPFSQWLSYYSDAYNLDYPCVPLWERVQEPEVTPPIVEEMDMHQNIAVSSNDNEQRLSEHTDAEFMRAIGLSNTKEDYWEALQQEVSRLHTERMGEGYAKEKPGSEDDEFSARLDKFDEETEGFFNFDIDEEEFMEIIEREAARQLEIDETSEICEDITDTEVVENGDERPSFLRLAQEATEEKIR